MKETFSTSVALEPIVAAAIATPAAPALPAGPLAQLPAVGADADPYWRLVTAFLVGYPPHSSPQPATSRVASPASIARRPSCLSKFYGYGIQDAELLEHSPVSNVRRPKVLDDSATVGLTAEELDRLLTAAEEHGPKSAALVSLLVYNGLRIAEVLACDIEHFSHQRGHRVLRIVRTGGKASTAPLAPIVLHTLETYVAERTSGSIFLNAEGTERLSYSTSKERR
jgi:integrase/recombinase XerD